MEHENAPKRFESVYSTKVRAGKRRTYFFDVRRTKGDDFYITLTESTRRFNGDGYERHKIFLYKEDFNRFLTSLEEAVNHVKTELMPDYDYDEFTKRQLEWEARRAEEDAKAALEGTESHDTVETVAEGDTSSEDETIAEEVAEEEAVAEVADVQADGVGTEEVVAEPDETVTTAAEEPPSPETTTEEAGDVDEEEDMSW